MPRQHAFIRTSSRIRHGKSSAHEEPVPAAAAAANATRPANAKASVEWLGMNWAFRR